MFSDINMHVLQIRQIWDDPTSVTYERFRRDFYYIWTSHPSLWIGAVQCNILTDILDFFTFRFENFQKEHLCTEVHLPFGEVGWNVPEYFSSEKGVQQWRGKKLWRKKNSSKNFTSVFLFYYLYFLLSLRLNGTSSESNLYINCI